MRHVPAILLLAVLGGLAWLVLRVREPVYAGKPLSEWLRQRDEESTNAIRQIGADALPALLELAQARDSALKKRLLEIALWHDISLIMTVRSKTPVNRADC
mgnify:CR=1 FL=1